MFILMQWLVVRYAQQNLEQIIEAIRIAKQEGLSVSLDLASFEVCVHLYCSPHDKNPTKLSLVAITL